ncbi:dihydrolipoamide acetyltransferase family protein [Microbacterium oxydans]|uniref:Dihydrolipoamide acetyltransferase component of pyruvate dehydrogenase complex n=1 Tax=Microbacterium oxydans TaxID=82380 RepID=A0A0F0LG26_9MICO|nr:dihydrolipoamide acetyltransferase family protein [Microbacterium oxydans]KJL30496.1 Dihydrolipoyllysine-residue acetyltransferase component of pyruvate dehydrogenase complex [Microbacterium oxydans]
MIDILMPRLSDTMEEGAIATWHKQPGDQVAIGDILVEIETDKATMEYEAYEAGILREILVPEGEQATIGMVIALLDDGKPASPSAAPVPDAEAPVADAGVPVPEPEVPTEASARVLATPLVRRLAREHAIDLAHIEGSGPGGRIVRADLDRLSVPQAAASVAQPTAPEPRGSDDARQSTAVPFDRTRQVISRRLTESAASVPHFTVASVAVVDDLLALRAELNARLDAAGRARISVNDLVVRACAIALTAFPGVNASYSPEGSGATLQHGRVNIGIAVASDAGLVVPVISDADRKPASQIAADSRRLAERAKERGLTADDMAGGTFTISNLGMFGVEQFTAIINPPEGAILAVGAAMEEPVVIDGAVEVRRRMRYTLSADHRIIDGALAAKFLAMLTDLLEHPLDIIA